MLIFQRYPNNSIDATDEVNLCTVFSREQIFFSWKCEKRERDPGLNFTLCGETLS